MAKNRNSDNQSGDSSPAAATTPTRTRRTLTESIVENLREKANKLRERAEQLVKEADAIDSAADTVAASKD